MKKVRNHIITKLSNQLTITWTKLQNTHRQLYQQYVQN